MKAKTKEINAKKKKIIRKTREQNDIKKKEKGKDYLKLPVLLSLWCLWHDHICYLEHGTSIESREYTLMSFKDDAAHSVIWSTENVKKKNFSEICTYSIEGKRPHTLCTHTLLFLMVATKWTSDSRKQEKKQ